MKVKLLKKVRKRYTITRVDKNGRQASDLYQAVEDQLGLPFFVMEDTHDYFGYHAKFVKTFEEARIKLVERIVLDYKYKFKNKNQVSSKVWWTNK